jgi:hypothetical protein
VLGGFRIMPDAGFPRPVGDVVATLAEIFRQQGRSELVEVLQSANASFDQIDYDNWNGGTSTWALRLEVPVSVFASIESRLSNVEKEIEAKLQHFSRAYPNDHLNTVSVSPLASSAAASNARLVPSDMDVHRIWPDRMFRLFLSHVSAHRVAVGKLKDELARRGVAAFVAHEDIEPSLEWQNEIELALRSMHALAALITPDFHASLWTDQEMGWAFGRGLQVIPIRLGANPYGLAGKVQGLSGDLDLPAPLSSSIVDVLIKNQQTHGEMRRALAFAFSNASSFAMAKALCAHVVQINDFTEEEIATLQNACTANGQVANAFDVPSAIYQKFGKPELPKEEEIPF